MINNLVNFNKLAMENLTQQKFEMAYHFMHRAEKILNSLSESPEKSSLSLITYNNQACLYKALGQTYQSLDFLYKATTIIPSNPEDYFNLARCYLNLSLLKSEEKDSDSSLNYSLKALDILTNNCEEDAENYYENLCTAFNIIANQHKIKGNDEEALRVFKRGLDISSKFLGTSHPITQNFSKVFENRKLRFVKKPKSSGVNLPKMINRAWPQAYSSNKTNKEKSRRGTSMDFGPDSKNFKFKKIFTKEVTVYNGKKNFSLDPVLRKTQDSFGENFESGKGQKNKKLLDKLAVTIQKAFRAFIAKEEVENFKDSKLTRRQLAEKRAIIALQEFEILREIAEKENPYFETSTTRFSAKLQSRRSSAKNSKN